MQGGFKFKTRRLSTLPRSFPRSTIDVDRLNYCVRNGNRCDPVAIATENILHSISGYVIVSLNRLRRVHGLQPDKFLG